MAEPGLLGAFHQRTGINNQAQLDAIAWTLWCGQQLLAETIVQFAFLPCGIRLKCFGVDAEARCRKQPSANQKPNSGALHVNPYSNR